MDTNLQCGFCVDKYCQALKNIIVKFYLLIREFFPITVVLSGLTMFNVISIPLSCQESYPCFTPGELGQRKVKDVSKWQNYVHQVI